MHCQLTWHLKAVQILTFFFLLFTVDSEMNQFYRLHKPLKRYHDGVFSASYNHYTRWNFDAMFPTKCFLQRNLGNPV